MCVDDVLERVRDYEGKWVCFTGGEPLLQRDSIKFVDGVNSMGKNVLLETGGSLSIRKMTEREKVFIDMDVKTPSSGEENSILTDNLPLLRDQDYLKFVISDMKDLDYSTEFITNHDIRVEVLLQPAWGTSLQWLTEQVLERGINARVLPQLHKIIWGERRGV